MASGAVSFPERDKISVKVLVIAAAALAVLLIVCVGLLIFVMSGDDGKEVPGAVNGEIILLGEWTNKLSDKESDEFKELVTAVDEYATGACTEHLEGATDCKVHNISFTPGSVIATFVITFKIKEKLASKGISGMGEALVKNAEKFESSTYTVDKKAISTGNETRVFPMESGAVSGEVPLMGEWTDNLNDKESQEFKDLKTSVEDYVTEACTEHLAGATGCQVDNINFIPGSVMATFVVTFNVPQSIAWLASSGIARGLALNSAKLKSDKYTVNKDSIVTVPGNEGRKLPVDLGLNLDEMVSSFDWPRLREGQATDNHTCDEIRELPPWLRDKSFRHMNLSSYYTKYTEAYNISVVGSPNVTDDAMRSACYRVRFLLASRYDIRNMLYKFYVRVALIADGHQQTTLPEYNDFDSNYWDKRARGLGPTRGIPVTSAGCDNLRCKTWERYPGYDLLVHEFSHGIHTMGADYVIPGFTRKMNKHYKRAHAPRIYGKGAYATENRLEYFAETSQMYFGGHLSWIYTWRRPNGTKVTVNTRATLTELDPAVVAIHDEVHPCFKNRPTFVQLCCTDDVFTRIYPGISIKKSPCQKISHGNSDTVSNCLRKACRSQARIATFTVTAKGKSCFVHDCNQTEYETFTDENLPGIMQQSKTSTTYIMDEKWSFDKHTRNKLLYEFPETLCTRGEVTQEECDAVPTNNRTQCGPPDNKDPVTCKKRGCCFADDMCFYKKHKCYDDFLFCAHDAGYGECERNPGYMLRVCKWSCGICDNPNLYPYTTAELKNLCQDTNNNCQEYSRQKYCTSKKHGANIRKQCQISCGECTLDGQTKDPLKAIMDRITGPDEDVGDFSEPDELKRSDEDEVIQENIPATSGALDGFSDSVKYPSFIRIG